MTLRYVALGDSYTIGTAVAEDERWPNQLVRRLAGHPPALELVANLAVNGYTSRDVIRRQLPRLATLGPGFVSLLVGVNDVVQGVDPEVYRTNVAAILDAMATSVPTGRIVVVTTPDYTVTPRGSDYGDPARQSAAIRVFNGIMTEASVKHEVAVVDVLDLSLDANADRSLVAEDGLHPSGVQYARWIDRIAPTVRLLLAGEPTC